MQWFERLPEHLRDYQSTSIHDVEALWNDGKRAPLAVSPVGSGKGTIAAAMAACAAMAGARVLFLAPRVEIVRDTAERIAALYARVGVILPGERRDAEAPIQVATIQSLLGSELRKYDLTIGDEAHHIVADEWGAVFERAGSPRCIGFTATPWRMDGRPMGDAFDALVDVVSYSELLRRGFIVPSIIRRPPNDLGRDLAQDPALAYLRYAYGTSAFVFAGSVKHAEQVRKQIAEAGVTAGIIVAGTSAERRKEAFRRFHDGELKVLVNYDTMSEGIDAPAASTVVLGRRCAHVGAYIQRVGRVLRAHPGKEQALVIDLTGCSLAYGFPTDDRAYSLEGAAARATGGGIGTDVDDAEDGAERTFYVPLIANVDLELVSAHQSRTGGTESPSAKAPKSVNIGDKGHLWRALMRDVAAGVLTMPDAMKAYRAKHGRAA